MSTQRISKLLKNDSPGFLRFGDARMALLDIESGFWSIRYQVEALIGPRLTKSVLQQAGANGGASFAASFGATKDAAEQGQLFESCVQGYQTAGFGQFEVESAHWPIGRVSVRARDTFEAWMIHQHRKQVEGPVCAYTAGVLVGFVNVVSDRQDVVCIERHCQALGDDFCEFELLPVADAGDQSVVAITPDPTLGRQLNLLEMLFERMPMGIAVIDRDFKMVRCNPTWAGFIDEYTPSLASQVVPGAWIFDLEPGTEETLIPLFERVFQGETVRQDAVQLESGGIASYWDIVLSPLYEENQVVGLLNVSINATERVQVEKQLNETLARLGESESMLRSVIENAQHFAIYRVQVDLNDPHFGKVVLVSPSIQELLGVEDPYDFSNWFASLHPDDYDRIVEANRQSMEKGVPYNQPARIFNEEEKRWRWVQTISNPGFDEEGHLTHFDGMIIDLTDQKEAELALQEINATLEQRVEERTYELKRRQDIAESMRDIIGMINSKLSLDVFLDRAVKLAAQRIGAAACVLHQFDLENQTLSQVASFGMMDVFSKRRTRGFDVLKPSGGDYYLKATLQRQPTYTNYPPLPERVDEIQRDPTIPDKIKAERIALRQKFAGSFSVPIYIQDKVYGGMVFYYTEPQDFTDEQIQLGLTFAEQVAVALENARLHQQAQDRQRELQMLLDVAAVANSSLDLDDTLITTLDLLVDLVGASRAGVVLADESNGKLGSYVIRPERNVPPDEMDKMLQACEVVFTNAEPLYVEPDESTNLLEPGALLPLRAREQILGVLVIIGVSGNVFNQSQLDLFKSIADQLGIAVENARLYEQAEQVAAAQERNRLARDLHDAVSQTLFSASLIADVLPVLWDRNPEAGKQKLDELRVLTRGALSEMRTLLLELRPASLRDMDLGDLLRHLTNAFTGRTRVPIELTVDGQDEPSPKVKEVFYRVAQEALNNITKHAEASQVNVYLQLTEGQTQLEIRDDGRGFVTQDRTSENLGLDIMRERAETIGAQLSIDSEVGKGTRIELLWKEDQND